MAVTLAQAMVNAATDVDYRVIDDLRRYDGLLLDKMVFDDTVNPSGGTTLVYGYNRLLTPSSAMTRAVNNEYIPQRAARTQVTVTLKQFGTSFEIDRVVANLGQAATNEVNFQLQQAIVSTRMKFNELLILGDSAVDVNAFDGISKILTGSTTEVNTTTLDISATAITSQALALAALDRLDLWLASIYASRMGSGQGDMTGAIPAGERAILGNTQSIARVRALARWAGLYTLTRDDMGRQVESYNGWILLNIGDRNDVTGPIIPIGAAVANETDLYAVSFGLDALHGASAAGGQIIKTWLPAFDQAGAVHLGEVEFGPMALVLKSTKAAGVFRKVKVA